MKQQEHPDHKGKLRPSPFGWPLADEQCDDSFCWCKAGKKHVGAIKNVCGDGRCWCVQYWPTQYPGGMGIGGEHRRCECHECTQARAVKPSGMTYATVLEWSAQQVAAERERWQEELENDRNLAISRLHQRLAPERISEADIHTEIYRIREERAPK